jgi:RNA polymerase sigma factor (sigma-70 family)
LIENENQPGDSKAGVTLAAAARGDESAWADLVHTYSRLVWSVIRNYGISETTANDVYQAVWLRLIENADRIRDPRCLPGWLATTTRNECHHLARKATRFEYDDSLVDRADSTPSPEEQWMRRTRDRIVDEFVDRLPERHQRLLRVLMADARPDYRVVSTMLGMPIGSIGPTRARALARLRREFAKAGITEYGQIG